jgi:ribosomal protein S18 acetylase RimI-like enzyme
MAGDYFIRPASPADQEFLWEMLYQSLHVPEGGVPFSRDILSRPEIRRYVEDWGRNGDLGVVAVDQDNGQSLGAAWVRLLIGDAKGYGYVDGDTPELGMAVRTECRGRGTGTALLTRVLEAASTQYDSVSLSVSLDNPAFRLYERFGFEQMAVGGTSVTMVKRLRTRTDGERGQAHLPY